MKFSEGEVISASFLPELLHSTSWDCRGRMVVVKQATTPPAKGFTSGLPNGAIGALPLSLLNDRSSIFFHLFWGEDLNAERRGVHLGISGDSVSELLAVRSLVCCLAEPRPQHIHLIKAVDTHLLAFVFRPAGVVDGELGIAFVYIL